MRYRNATLLLLFIVSVVGCQSGGPAPTSGASMPAWSVCFSPHGHCTSRIVDALAGAKRTVRVQAYSFTSAPIAQALIDAHKRGVNVQVILDKSQRMEQYSASDLLLHAGIPVSIDAIHAIAHNKVMVIDDDVVITGSFNFSKAAEERNAENLLVFHDRLLAAEYAANWQRHREHAEVYHGK